VSARLDCVARPQIGRSTDRASRSVTLWGVLPPGQAHIARSGWGGEEEGADAIRAVWRDDVALAFEGTEEDGMHAGCGMGRGW
jgi:hypothetical protein